MRTLSLALILLAPSAQDAPCPWVPKDLVAARSRVRHQALLEGLLLNLGPDAPLDVRATALDAEGKELGGFEPAKFESVREGRAVRLKFALDNQPDFAGYRLDCVSGDKTWTWTARPFDQPPSLSAGDPAPMPKSTVAVAGLDLLFGKFQGKAYAGDTVALRLRIPEPQEVKLSVRVTFEGRELGKIVRTVPKSAWKVDAKKAFEKESVPGVVAHDGGRDEIVVTLFSLRKDTPLEKLVLDVAAQAGGEKLEWKDLTDPFVAVR